MIGGNEADAYGGGVPASSESALELDHVLIVDNRARSFGGGVEVSSTSTVSLSYTVVAGNESTLDGAGISTRSDGVAVAIEHSVVVGNAVCDLSEGKAAGVALIDGYDGAVSHVVVSENVGGPGVGSDASTMVAVEVSDAWGNEGGDYVGMTDPAGTGGNLSVDPSFLDTSARFALDPDLHLGLSSPVVDAGNPAQFDPDGSRADIGPYGGEGADDREPDGDGFPAWWQPGPYTSDLTTQGWDRDDLDAGMRPGSGC